MDKLDPLKGPGFYVPSLYEKSGGQFKASVTNLTHSDSNSVSMESICGKPWLEIRRGEKVSKKAEEVEKI